jgi:hypothetical protein
MPKTPSSRPDGWKCDPRLPIEALAFRRSIPALLTPEGLGRINVTAWLYLNDAGARQVKVNPNITLAQIRAEFGRAPTRDAETGIHSEGIAGEFFRVNPTFRVLEIFTERVPCRIMCAPMLRNYFPGVPWFYYYDRESWRDNARQLIKRAADTLRVAYGL